MKKRVITGTFYVLIMVGILVMKILIPPVYTESGRGIELGALGIDIIFLLIAVFGSFEFLRAVKEVSLAQRWAAMITCALLTPCFAVCKLVFCATGASVPFGALGILLCVAGAGAVICAALCVFDHENSDVVSTALSEGCILYCGLLSVAGTAINHLDKNSVPAVLLLFIIVPLVDTFAFFFGKLLGKRLPKKLAPNVSPNKTVIGGVGGIVGGLVAGVFVWVLCEYAPNVAFEYNGKLPLAVVFLLISLPTACIAQIGDLFESAIKRNCGVKDMGNILPGHGGVLDRFDSMLFASLPILVCFLFI